MTLAYEPEDWKEPSEIDALRAFAKEVMECWPMGGIDGGELQDIAEKYGLLKPETRHAPCREEGCTCAEYADEREFANGVTCYRETPLLFGHNAKPSGGVAVRLSAELEVFSIGENNG